MTKWLTTVLSVATLAITLPAHAAENLKLNQHLDYTSDSQDGPLITGDRLEEAAVPGKPAYAIFLWRRLFQFQAAGAAHGRTLRKVQGQSAVRRGRSRSSAFF